MKRKKLWITLALVNLCITALLGVTLRTKFLFSVPFIDYRNFLSAHSHFAFGGWVTLILMILSIDNLLTNEQKQKKIYQWILWGIELNALGMAISFPFKGYALFSILTSTLFIFFTYWFGWVFIKDIRKANNERPISFLSISAVIWLVISSVGPFTLAYIMSTHKGDAFLYRDSVYTYLHFQYNGFFTFSVFALLFKQILPRIDEATKKKFRQFAFALFLSVIPALFLTLLWHSSNIYVRSLAFIGCSLIFLSLLLFFRFVFKKNIYSSFTQRLARSLLVLSMFSFGIKMLLQMGTIIPSLAHAVFGYRPIIIGFLHLVFLGFVSFYVFSNLLASGTFSTKRSFPRIAILFFTIAILFNETVLLVQGIGLMFNISNPIYPQLLWIAALLLLTGALLILTARLSNKKAVE